MYKTIVLICFLFFTVLSGYTQSQLSQITTKINSNRGNETITVIDNEENIHVFFFTSKHLIQHKYDKSFKFIHSKEHPSHFMEYSNYEGYYVDANNDINIYFSDSWKKRFVLFSITAKGEFLTKPFSFDIKSEKRIENVNAPNAFHVFTYAKKGSIIKRYTLTKDKITPTEFDLNATRFYSNQTKETTLAKLFKRQAFEIIKDDVPASIEIAAKKIKLFQRNDKLLIGLNHRKNATRLIELSLNDAVFKVDHFFIPTKTFEEDPTFKSNSFVYETHLFQMISSKNQLLLTMHDLQTKEKIKEYSISRDDSEITFSNSPIYQDGNSFTPDATRNLELTKQYLRKITRSDVGLTVYKKEDVLQLTMGGIKEVNTGGGAMMMPMGGGVPIGSTGAVTVSFTPMMGAYNSYSHSKSVYFRSLLDPKTFNHLPGPTYNNVFDEISDYSADLETSTFGKHIRLENIFRFQNHFVYGYYHKKNQIYYLVKFEK